MRALVPTEVDPLARAVDAAQQRLDELVRLAHEREDRAVMIRVHVHVEQPGGRGQRPPQGVHDCVVAPL